jgi:hypothetical protein
VCDSLGGFGVFRSHLRPSIQSCPQEPTAPSPVSRPDARGEGVQVKPSRLIHRAAVAIQVNWSSLMAGTTSTNPLLFAITGLLVLAWKTAGYYGLDRYLLPLLGTPWRQSG